MKTLTVENPENKWLMSVVRTKISILSKINRTRRLKAYQLLKGFFTGQGG